MKSALTPRLLVLFIMMVLSTLFAIQVISFDKSFLYGENQLMEHTQLIILLIVGIAFWRVSGAYQWKKVKRSSASLSLLAYLGAALSFSFILREMSIKKTEIDWLIYFVDGQGFKIIMAMVWLPLLYKAFQFKSEYIYIIRQAILSPTAIFLMIAASLLLMGGLFDKEIIVVKYFRFYEELLEMNGYGFMLLAAFSFRHDMIHAVCHNKHDAMRALCNETESRAMATPVSVS